MPLTVCRFIRKMRGGAQSHLLETTDGGFYIVKFQNNPQHRRILVNELISAELLRYLQISTPQPALIEISEEFLRQNPDVCITLGSQRLVIQPGWHFGSRHPGHPERTPVYDFIPDSLLVEVSNLADYLGVAVFDKWAGNADGRQCIFFRAQVRSWDPSHRAKPLKTGFVTAMIDHGFVFQGPNWSFHDSPIQGLYPRKVVYSKVTSLDSFQPWLDQVVHFPEEVIDRACKQIPPKWIDGEEEELERVLEKLLERRKTLPELLIQVRNARPEVFPNWK